MKQNMKNAAFGLIALFAVSTIAPAMAHANNDNPAAEMKLVGRQNNQPLYQLRLNNTATEEVIVIVKDNLGEVFHHEVLKGKNLSRTFQLNFDNMADADLRVEVINRTTGTTTIFSIVDGATVSK